MPVLQPYRQSLPTLFAPVKTRCRHIRTHKFTAKAYPSGKVPVKITSATSNSTCKDSRVLLPIIFLKFAPTAKDYQIPLYISLVVKIQVMEEALPQYLSSWNLLPFTYPLTTLATASANPK